MMIKNKEYNRYVNWFSKQFNGIHPTNTYYMVNAIDEMVAMRNEYQDKNILDYAPQKEIERILEKLKIITFDEYKNIYPFK